MNFIVFALDTLRPDHVGAYGVGLAQTPNLDRFASEALRFNRAYCGSFFTIPCRHDLFTGTFGAPFHAWAPLSYMDVTLPEVLRKNGYVTQLIHDTPHLINYGFGFDRPFHAWWMIRGNEVDRCWTDHHTYRLDCAEDRVKAASRPFELQHRRNIRGRSEAEEERFAPQVMTAVARWLEDNHKQEKFFLWVDCFDPHEPWDPPKKYVDMYDPGYTGQVITNFFNSETITEDELRHIRACYAGKVTMVDAWIARALAKIDELGLRDNTAVIILSDHGTGLGDHQSVHKRAPLYEECGRIVWMMRVPGQTPAGAACEALAQPPDLMPTILDLAGLEADYQPQGISLTPAFADGAWRGREFALAGQNGVRADQQAVTVDDGDWAYLHRLEPHECELYHTAEDRGQKRNLIREAPERAARMREAMLATLAERGTPEQILEMHRTRRISLLPEPTALEARMAKQRLGVGNMLDGAWEVRF